jgi:hypothetical protein
LLSPTPRSTYCNYLRKAFGNDRTPLRGEFRARWEIALLITWVRTLTSVSACAGERCGPRADSLRSWLPARLLRATASGFLELLRGCFELGVDRSRIGVRLGLVAGVLVFGLGLGDVCGDGARVIEQLAAGGLEELVELFDPIAHGHRGALERLELGELDVEVHDAMEHLQLGLGEVVLRHRRVGFADQAAGPRRLHAHEWLVGVGALVDDLGGGVSVRGPVHLVLDRREELLREVNVGSVVDAGGVDVEDLLVEAPLGGADVADPREQLVEVVGVAGTGRVLEPLVVHCEALDQVFGEARGGPLAELGAAVAADAEADGEDGVEGVVLDFTGNRAIPLGSNYPVAPDSCLQAQFALVVDVHEVLVDRADVLLEQLRHQGLGEPKGLALEAALDAGAPVLGLVEDQLALGGLGVGHGAALSFMKAHVRS